MMFLYNIDWDLDKKQVKKLLKAMPDARLIKNTSNPIADYELWVPESQFFIAWTMINHSCLMQTPSKKCKELGIDCKIDCPQMFAEDAFKWYIHQINTVKKMVI